MRLQLAILLGGLFGLSACASSSTSGYGRAGASAGYQVQAECAPFAPALTGVQLSGAAAEWWQQADGRYARTHAPDEGTLLVFRRSSRLRYGHVAVVSRVLSEREVLVTQANWVHDRVTEDQPVVDVSPYNDWSLVRVWWPPSDTMGTTAYPAYGFIRPDQPPSHDQLIAATARAIRMAAGG